MNKTSGVVVMFCLALAGCIQKKPVRSVVSPHPPAQTSMEKAIQEAAGTASGEQKPLNSSSSSVQQCRKELDALRLYNSGLYQRYLNEFQQTGEETQKYLEVKDTLGADINSLAMPHYQFRIRELCFRVKTHLARLMINQEK